MDKELAIQTFIVLAILAAACFYGGYKWREVKWNMEHEARRKGWQK